tara:strand:+ start:2649 stop:2969 length:321 start_codon:yes stop_codon:yes gene_type:complete
LNVGNKEIKMTKETKELSEDTAVKLSLKTLGGIATLIAILVGMWFTLQADITEAKELPAPLPPDVSRMEFDMKDQNIRMSIENTEKVVDEIKLQLIRMEDKMDKLR